MSKAVDSGCLLYRDCIEVQNPLLRDNRSRSISTSMARVVSDARRSLLRIEEVAGEPRCEPGGINRATNERAERMPWMCFGDDGFSSVAEIGGRRISIRRAILAVFDKPQVDYMNIGPPRRTGRHSLRQHNNANQRSEKDEGGNLDCTLHYLQSSHSVRHYGT